MSELGWPSRKALARRMRALWKGAEAEPAGGDDRSDLEPDSGTSPPAAGRSANQPDELAIALLQSGILKDPAACERFRRILVITELFKLAKTTMKFVGWALPVIVAAGLRLHDAVRPGPVGSILAGVAALGLVTLAVYAVVRAIESGRGRGYRTDLPRSGDDDEAGDVNQGHHDRGLDAE